VPHPSALTAASTPPPRRRAFWRIACWRAVVLLPVPVAGLLWTSGCTGAAGPGEVADARTDFRVASSDETRSWRIPGLALPALPAEVPEAAGPAVPLVRLELSDGVERPGEAQPLRPGAPQGAAGAAPEPLSPQRTAELLSRLPPAAQADPGEDGERAQGLEAREVGAPGQAPETEAALSVHSVFPMGVADLIPWVTVTFSDAMVPLGPDGAPLQGGPLVDLDPEPPGTWRWLDVRTLRFEPAAGRMPGATRFTLQVPAGTRSARGATLAGPVEASFASRGALAVGAWPQPKGTASREPVVLLTFDQRVRPADVLASARLWADGEPRALALADEEVLADEDPRLPVAARRAGEGYWAALRTEQPLPAGAQVRLELDQALASAEGPEPAGRPQELTFHIRGPLEVSASRCPDPNDPCPADERWWVHFSNPLEPELDLESLVRVEPEVDGLRIHQRGHLLALTGDFRPHTGYRITLEGRIRDRFGQSLDPARTLAAHIGRPARVVRIPDAPLLTLDPVGAASVDVDLRAVEEVEVELYRVEPDDWPDFLQVARPTARSPRDAEPPGVRVAHSRIQAPDGGRGFSRLPVDLAPALDEGGLGHAVLRVTEVPKDEEGRPARPNPVSDIAWVQSTRLGVGAAWDPRQLVVAVHSLLDGAPMDGVAVALPGSGGSARTGDDGLTRLPLGEDDAVLVARRDEDSALMVHGRLPFQWAQPWRFDPHFPHPTWSVFSDRGLYQPGEEMRIHGWIRERSHLGVGEPLLPGRVDSVAYRIQWPDQSGEEEGSVEVSATGAFHLQLQVPRRAAAGQARVHLHALGGDRPPEAWGRMLYVGIEEFRRPEYEVRVESDPDLRFLDEAVEVRVDARYYDGPPLPGAKVDWWVGPDVGWHAPEGWAGWTFGPDWRHRPRMAEERAAAVATHEAQADPEGTHVLSIHPRDPLLHFPLTLDVRVQVQDLDRQAGSARTQVLLHPAAVYAGIQLPAGRLVAGDELGFQVVVVDPEARPRPHRTPRVEVQRVEPDEAEPSPGLAVVESRPASCRETLLEGPDQAEVPGLACREPAMEEGTFRVVATVEDEAGRRARAERVVQVQPPSRGALPSWLRFPAAGAPRLEVELDRNRYEPGDTVRLTVRSPVYPARGAMVETHAGIRRAFPVELDGPATELTLLLPPERLGSSQLTLRLVAARGERRDLQGAASVIVLPEARQLEVSVQPEAAEASPGDHVEVEVRVRDDRGDPVSGGEVTLWVVDEAVLALARYRAPDPHRELAATGVSTRDHLHLAELVRWPRRSPGPGRVSGRLIDAAQGRPLAGHEVRLEGGEAVARSDGSGEFVLDGVSPGSRALRIHVSDELVDEHPVELEGEALQEDGVDLGEILVLRGPRMPQDPPPSVPEPRGARPLALQAVQAGPPEIELPAPTGFSDLPAPPVGDDAFVAVREDFSPLAAFEPAVRTDADGRARIRIRLPDTATRYRILATASRGAGEFGTGEGTLVARREFLVRPSFPRFLHPGDRAELTLLVQNLSEEDRPVDVAARAPGLEMEGSGGVRVQVGAGNRREVRIPARARHTGPQRIEVVAVGGELSDAAAVTVPVEPALAPRITALHAEVEEGAVLRLPVAVPADALPEFGELEVGLSTSVLEPLVEELAVLFREPELWPSATVARVLGSASLGERLGDFVSKRIPPAKELEAQIEEDVRYLVSEVYSRWLGFGGGGNPAVPSLSLPPLGFLDGVLALRRAAEAGYDEASRPLHGLTRHLRDRMEALLDRYDPEEAEARRYRAHSIAYTAFVLHQLAGGSSTGLMPRGLVDWAARLVPDALDSETLAWLAVVLADAQGGAPIADAFQTALLNRAVETGATATFRTGAAVMVAGAGAGEEQLLLDSRRRTDAIVLTALLQLDPEHPVLPRVLRGLLAHMDGTGHRTSHHEAGWLLTAAGDYARIREGPAPDLVARAWLGDVPFMEEAFDQHTYRSVVRQMPLEGLPLANAEGGSLLTVERSGTGPLLVRASLRSSPADPFQPPEARGFVVDRRYEAVDDPGDVHRDADGTWHVRAGARVRVRVTFAATARRYQVRLRDPLPAGLEAINPRLEGGALPDEDEEPPTNRPVGSPACHPLLDGHHPGSLYANWTECMVDWRLRAGFPWHTYRQLRSNRMEAYAALVPAGTYETTYLVRATSPGTFVAAPPEIYELRHGETRGRGGADRIVVEVRDTGR
jgi:uncharacterized protein YfaS (alpha-2-macroglobulin family)